MNKPHWSEPSAPDQSEEARYRRAVASGLSQSEFEAQEAEKHAAEDAEMDATIAAAQDHATSEAERWDSIYRAAVCAAAQAIQSRNWDAKRQALSVAQQADDGRQRLIAAIFGAPRSIPHQYAELEKAGRSISRDESSAALKVIAADRDAARQQRPQRGANGRFPVSESRRRG